jgi:acyl-CoA thioester hydrolase
MSRQDAQPNAQGGACLQIAGPAPSCASTATHAGEDVMARADFRFSYPKRVRVSEIDIGGVVFNARYLDYLDIVVTEYFRAVRSGEGAGIGAPYLVARTELNYRASIRFDELIDLCMRCARIGTSSVSLSFEYHGLGETNDLRCDGETVLVHLDANGRPAPLPPALIAQIEAFEERSVRA